MNANPTAPRQPELFRGDASVVEPEELEWLIARLKGAARPRTAAEIVAEAKGIARDQVKEGEMRRIRSIVAASEGQITGTDAGYVLTVEMTAEEFSKADTRQRHMAREIVNACIKRRRVFFRQTNPANR
jgi:hypothetical protein